MGRVAQRNVFSLSWSGNDPLSAPCGNISPAQTLLSGKSGSHMTVERVGAGASGEPAKGLTRGSKKPAKNTWRARGALRGDLKKEYRITLTKSRFFYFRYRHRTAPFFDSPRGAVSSIHVRVGSGADLRHRCRDVCSWGKSGPRFRAAGGPFIAKRRHSGHFGEHGFFAPQPLISQPRGNKHGTSPRCHFGR